MSLTPKQKAAIGVAICAVASYVLGYLDGKRWTEQNQRDKDTIREIQRKALRDEKRIWKAMEHRPGQ